MTKPVLLIICLSKSWSDEARAAALAARLANQDGHSNPKAVGDLAKEYVRRGFSVTESVKKAQKDTKENTGQGPRPYKKVDFLGS